MLWGGSTGRRQPPEEAPAGHWPPVLMSRAELGWDWTEAVSADAQGPWVGDPRVGRARGTPTHRVAVDPHPPVDEPGAVGQAAQAAADVAVPLSLREQPVRGQLLSGGRTHRAATEDACSR